MKSKLKNIELGLLNIIFITYLIGVVIGVVFVQIDSDTLHNSMFFTIQPFSQMLYGSHFEVFYSILALYGGIFVLISILGVSMIGSKLILWVNGLMGIIGGYSYLYLATYYHGAHPTFVILLILLYVLVFLPAFLYYEYRSISISQKIRFSFLKGRKVVTTKKAYQKHVHLIWIMFGLFMVYIIFMTFVVGGIY